MGVTLAEWARLLDAEYLSGYVASGGSAAKIGVAAPEAAEMVRGSVAAAAQARGYVVAQVDSARTRVHMIDHVFHEVARQVDWEGTACAWLRGVAIESGLRIGPEQDMAEVERIAQDNGLDRPELVRELMHLIRNHLLKDYSLGREFRTAVGRLCASCVNPQSVTGGDREVVLQWVRGDKCGLPALKHLGIYQRIGRQNARLMLASLARWLAMAGHSGLALILDLNAVVADVPRDGALHYVRRTVLDVYEVLRQFIDDTDEAESLLVVAVAGPGFVVDPRRSVDNYLALKLRVENEVRDRQRANPLNTMVDLDTADQIPEEATWTGTP